MKFIDLFAGVGGFRRGMELAGHECVGFCEFDKYAVASYTAMHLLTKEQRERIESIPAPLKKNGEPNYRKRQQEILKEEYRNGEWYANDIKRVDAASVPRADIWCFGAPCQDFSIAGDRKGLKGDRSALVREVFRIIRETEEKHRPEYIIYENVKGMLSSNNGWDFACIQIEMEQLGYDVEYELLNTKNFGIPHNRERVFIVGHLRGRSAGKIFPLSETSGIHNATKETGKIYEVAQCLTAGGNDKWQGDYIVKQIGNCMPTKTRENPNQGRIYDTSGIAPCLNKMDGGGKELIIPVTGVAMPILTPDRKNKRQNGRRMKEDGEPMFTLTAQDVHGVAISGAYTGASEDFTRKPLEGLSRCLKGNKHDAGITDGMRYRRLTPKECFRLQGWEDEYFDRAAAVNSDSQLYKQAGNGVTVAVVKEIGERLK